MTFRRWLLLLGGTAAALATYFWLFGKQHQTDKIILSGSTTMVPLVTEIAEAYKNLHPELKIEILSGDSTGAINEIKAGTADIALVSRPLHEHEADLVPVKIATDGIAFITNINTPLSSLTFEGIRSIFKGEITYWHELGGHAEALQVIQKPERYAATEVLLRFLNLTAKDLAPNATIVSDDSQTITTVSENQNALAYTSIAIAEFALIKEAQIKLIPLDGIIPSSENVRNGSYPLVLPLNLVTKGAPEGTIADFIHFAQSQKAQEIVQAKHFVHNSF